MCVSLGWFCVFVVFYLLLLIVVCSVLFCEEGTRRLLVGEMRNLIAYEMSYMLAAAFAKT